MPLMFYYGSGSPYAWRVWLALEHKGIAYEQRVMSFSVGDLRKPEFLAINRRGRVPAIDDDGFALFESVAIVEYLDEKYGGPRLFPGDARSRALVRRLNGGCQVPIGSYALLDGNGGLHLRGLVGSVKVKGAAAVALDELVYGFLSDGSIQSIEEKYVTGGPGADSFLYQYGYDAQNRLTSADYPAALATLKQMLIESSEHHLSDALANEQKLFQQLVVQDEAKRGMRATQDRFDAGETLREVYGEPRD